MWEDDDCLDPNNCSDPNDIPGLIELAEHIDSSKCDDPSDHSNDGDSSDDECPHVNYRIPAPNEPQDGSRVHVHPEPVLDVSSLLNCDPNHPCSAQRGTSRRRKNIE
jgi:hypothetical protein